jgi:DNA-binding winged helix-turn-helix (wHTH) protein
MDRQFAFGNFRFDARTGQLWRDGSETRLTPRATAVLQLLAERAQELVTKEEIFERVWGGMAIGDDSLTSCIRELRGALGDDARRPQTIETWHRRGYRLMPAASPIADRSDATAQAEPTTAEPSRLVGRAAELEELAQGFEHARSGRRQIVFVTGEPGIGKSSLANAFLEHQLIAHEVRIAQGQCLDRHGMGEPYLPLIEALTRLAGNRDGKAVKEILWAQALSWLAQMPSLWTRSERSVLEARGRATRERMMRELTLAVETIASEVPLLLKLEDIHWSDAARLDWLAHVARRPEPARLMVLATFRPADAATAKAGLSALVAELAVHRRCQEIALRPLTLEAIEIYLAARLGARAQQLREIAPLLLERTGGNPLFVSGIVNQLARQPDSGETLGALVSIPPDIRRFIDRQIDDLDESDLSLLSAASVIRREFATAAVAASLETDPEQVEARCAVLARHGVFIIKSGSTTWPDGTPAELYAFRHDLYRELLYDRMPPTRRALYHGRVGRRLEAAWAGRLEAIAAEMAEHFDRANEPGRAIPHHQRAAAKAMRRSANGQAIRHLQQALDAIGHIADEIERTKAEVQLHIGLGAAEVLAPPKRLKPIPEPKRCANDYPRAPIFSRRSGECGWFGGGGAKSTKPGGFAADSWRWQRNPAMRGSNCKLTTPHGRPRWDEVNSQM